MSPTGKSASFRSCVRCVRACERAKLCVRVRERGAASEPARGRSSRRWGGRTADLLRRSSPPRPLRSLAELKMVTPIARNAWFADPLAARWGGGSQRASQRAFLPPLGWADCRCPPALLAAAPLAEPCGAQNGDTYRTKRLVCRSAGRKMGWGQPASQPEGVPPTAGVGGLQISSGAPRRRRSPRPVAGPLS